MSDLTGKKIAFLGYGLENQALLAWFKKQKLAATYTILDPHPQPEKLSTKVAWQSGKNYYRTNKKRKNLFGFHNDTPVRQ